MSATQNEFFTTERTSLLQKLLREVVNDPATYLGSKYLPSIAIPTDVIRTEVVEASGGLTKAHAIGTDVKYIQDFGTRVQEFAPPAYKEAIHFDEKKILHLRKLGQNDPSKRGIDQYIDLTIDRLNRRLEARIEFERWNTIFSGGFTWMGRTFSYGIPVQNTAVPLYGLWSLDGVSPNDAANPIKDIRYWTQGGYSPYRKYKIKRGLFNPNTSRWVLDNANTKAYLSSIGANPTISDWTIEKLQQFLLPGGAQLVVYDGWYQTESVDATGKLVVTDAIYMVPDGLIFWEGTLPGGDLIGEFVQGIHLASGSVDAPGYGKFLVVEENIAPGTKGGPGNPYIDIISGVYGGVKLDRPFDTLISNVTGNPYVPLSQATLEL